MKIQKKIDGGCRGQGVQSGSGGDGGQGGSEQRSGVIVEIEKNGGGGGVGRIRLRGGSQGGCERKSEGFG